MDEPIGLHIEKAHEVVVAGYALEGTTKQKDDILLETPEDAIQPPIHLEALAKLSQISATRAAVIDAIACNTVGLGYETEVAKGHEQEVTDPRQEAKNLRALLEALARRDTRLDRPSLTELLKAVKKDEEEVGWGFIEVSRSKLTGAIDGLFHIPGKLMRRKVNRKGFILLNENGEENTEFTNFGEKVVYTKDGDPTAQLESGGSWNRNEALVFRLYTSESRDYGLPRDVALALEYAGDKLASEYNVSFFDAGGTPPTILFISTQADEGGGRVTFKVPQETTSRIAQTIKSDGGHRDRVAIVPLPPNSKVEKIELGRVSDRDMGFVNYRRDNISRVLMAFRLSPIFISVNDEGRYDAEVQRAISLEQVFDPEQDRYEDRLQHSILKDIGYSHMAIKFKRLAVESDKARRDSSEKLAEAGAITLREFRSAHGLPPLPEVQEGHTGELPPGLFPFGTNDKLVDVKQPRGAENRSTTDQRGLKPGVGQRDQRSTDNELEAQAERQTQAFAKASADLTDVAKSMGEQLVEAVRATRPPDPAPIYVEVPISIDKATTTRKVKRDEWGMITEVSDE